MVAALNDAAPNDGAERTEERRQLWPVAHWPMRWKIVAVLAVPLLLAVTLGVVRVQAQIGQTARLSTAADRVAVIAPAIAVADATEGLALAAVAGASPGPAASAFDAASAALTGSMGRVESTIGTELASATATAGALRNVTGSDPVPPGKVIEQVDDVYGMIAAAIAQTTADIDATLLDDEIARVRTIFDARKELARQRVLIAAPSTPSTATARAAALSAAGGENVVLGQLGAIDGVSKDGVTALRNEIDARRAAFAELGNGDARTAQQVTAAAASGAASADRYRTVTNDYVGQLDRGVHASASAVRSSALRDAALVLASLLVAFALAFVVARSLIRPVRTLRLGALQVAQKKLPDEIELIRRGKPVPVLTPVDVHTREEFGDLARAVDDIHAQAVRLAGEQATLRLQVADMFETLSRRSRTLVEKQLTLIEKLELDEDDPERLDDLFQLDHLATRMRRNGDNLLVLAGTRPPNDFFEPVPFGDVLRGALSEVENYRRVVVGAAPDGALFGNDAADVVHLVAELLDNALRFSPPTSTVSVAAARAVDGGYLIEIADTGIGMRDDDLRTTNAALASGGEPTTDTARRMGLFVVARLASRHRITVRLRATDIAAARPGVTASVHVPATAIVPATQVQRSTQQVVEPPLGIRRAATRSGSAPVESLSSGPAQSPVAAPPTPASTPIFASMTSQWPQDDAPRPTAGLPRRTPGAGFASGAAPAKPVAAEPKAAPSDAEAIRAALNGHASGVRDGRQHVQERTGGQR